MTIDYGCVIENYGTKDTVVSSGSSVSDSGMSSAEDCSDWTNDDDAPLAQVLLKWKYSSGTLLGDIHLHIQQIDVDGTADAAVPTSTDENRRCATFEIVSGQVAATDYYYVVIVNLKHFSTKASQQFKFFIYNESGVEISSGWALQIVPKSLGVHE